MKLYEIKKNQGSGVIIAKVTEVGEYKGRSTAWCSLNDGGKYDEKRVNVTNQPRELNHGDVGKTFEFDIQTKQNGQYTNIYAQVKREVSGQKQQSSQPSNDLVGNMIIAQVAAKIVKDLQVAGQVNPGATYDETKRWFDIIIAVGSGNVPSQDQRDQGCSDGLDPNANPFGDDGPPASDDDIPFGA